LTAAIGFYMVSESKSEINPAIYAVGHGVQDPEVFMGMAGAYLIINHHNTTSP